MVCCVRKTEDELAVPNMARLSMCRKKASMAICAPRPPILLFFIVLVLYLTSQTVLCKRNHLRVITDGNWEEVMEGEWMIEFFAPWCPACAQLQPVWSEFAEWGEDMGISIAKVDVTEQPGLSGRFIITSLPTIYHCKDGVFRKYEGARTKDDFLDFIDEKKWQDIEPISTWLGPSSFLMSGMSAVFKLSVFIRQCHNYFTEQLGIPVLVSYAIFVLAMLFTGLTLGLMLVFIADCVFPPRQLPPPHSYYQKKRTLEQARLTKQPETKQEGDGEDRGKKNMQGWRCPPEGEQESRGEGPSEETLRRRVLGTGEEEEDT